MIETEKPRTTSLERSFAVASGILIGFGVGAAILGLPLLSSAEIFIGGAIVGLTGVEAIVKREYHEGSSV